MGRHEAGSLFSLTRGASRVERTDGLCRAHILGSQPRSINCPSSVSPEVCFITRARGATVRPREHETWRHNYTTITRAAALLQGTRRRRYACSRPPPPSLPPLLSRAPPIYPHPYLQKYNEVVLLGGIAPFANGGVKVVTPALSALLRRPPVHKRRHLSSHGYGVKGRGGAGPRGEGECHY